MTRPAAEVAERVLELVRERAADAEAEVNVRTGTSALSTTRASASSSGVPSKDVDATVPVWARRSATCESSSATFW